MRMGMIAENKPTQSDELKAATNERAAPRARSPAARRALAEADERRLRLQPSAPPESGGRGGLEPTRYGDWEIKGLASDF
jgi:hypothetical protein